MGRITKQQVRDCLKRHVGIAELAEELGAQLHRVSPARLTAVCINPAHKDSGEPGGGGSLSVSPAYSRWQCFGNCRPGTRNRTEGDIFDLWGLARGLSPLDSGYANKTLGGVAELRQSLLDGVLPGWRDALSGRAGRLLEVWRLLLDRLQPYGLPDFAVDCDGSRLSGWLLTDLAVARNLLIASGAGRLRAERVGAPLVLVAFTSLDLFGIFTPDLEWLASVPGPGSLRSEDFAVRSPHEWLMTGYELTGRASSQPAPYRPVQLSFVAESPLDFVMLDRARLPAVMGRWQYGALHRIQLLPLSGRLLCLAALAVGPSDVPARFAEVLGSPEVPWIPRLVDFSEVPTLGVLSDPGREVAARLAISVVPVAR